MLLITLVTTAGFFGCAVLALPVAVCCAVGEFAVVQNHVQCHLLAAVCRVLCLIVLIHVDAGYCVGNGASQLSGMAMGVYSSLMSWIRSTMGGVFGSRNSETDPVGSIVLGFKRSIPKKHLQGAGDKDAASGTNSSAEGSPKISSGVGEEEAKSTSIVH